MKNAFSAVDSIIIFNSSSVRFFQSHHNASTSFIFLTTEEERKLLVIIDDFRRNNVADLRKPLSFFTFFEDDYFFTGIRLGLDIFYSDEKIEKHHAT